MCDYFTVLTWDLSDKCSTAFPTFEHQIIIKLFEILRLNKPSELLARGQ